MNEKLKEFNTYLKNRKVAVIGLGVSNLPLLDYLHEKGSIVTVFDDRNTEKISKEAIEKVNKYEFETSFGENNLDKLVGFDLIFRSPSCMPTKKELVEEEKEGSYCYF